MPNVSVNVIAIYRNRKIVIAEGSTIIQEGDDVFFLATEENMRFMSELGKNQSRVENIMIAGGGNVGFILAEKLSEKYSTKLIEKDSARSKYLSERLEHVVVLNDDISDESLLLNNEGIADVDYFCTVTNDDQMNILSAKLAKELGAKKSIAIINKVYRKLVSKEIDVVVSPEDVTIDQVISLG